MKKYILFLFIFFNLNAPNKAQNTSPDFSLFSYTFEGKTQEDSIDFYTFAGFGLDSSRQMSIKDVLTYQNILALQKRKPVFDNHKYYWACFRFINNTDDTLKKFMWSKTTFDSMTLYKIEQNAVVDATIRGRIPPLSMKNVLCQQRTFYIELKPHSQADYCFNYFFLIKHELNDSIFLFNQTRISDVHERLTVFEEPFIKFNNFLFTFLGILILMTLNQYFIFPRSRAFLYYVGYLFCIILYYFNSYNLYFRAFQDFNFLRPYFYLIEIMASYGCYAFYSLFILRFSDLDKRSYPLVKITYFFIALWLGLIPLHCIIIHYWGFSINNYLFTFTRILVLVLGVYSFYLLLKYGKYSLNIFIYIGIGCLSLFVLRDFIETVTELADFYPHNWLNNLNEKYRFVGVRMGVILESIFFSIGLIYKGRQLSQEQQAKELSLKQQYIDQLETTQQWQLKYQTELEQEIALKAGQLAHFEKEQAVAQLRNQIAQDIHDEIGSGLTKISLNAQVAMRLQDVSSEGYREKFTKIDRDAQILNGQMREVIFSINPEYDNFDDLQAYFKEQATEFWSQSGILPIFDFEKKEHNPIVSPQIKRQLLLIFKEAQNNIAKHAQTETIYLTFKLTTCNTYLLEIKDDGKGFETPLSNGFSKGLSGMKQRTHDINASFSMESRVGEGTLIRIMGKIY
jgi:signal transduction histidine kinase